MGALHAYIKFFKDAWSVLLLFLIPFGGGIPGGILLAKTQGIGWPLMMILYFISDVILACAFDPLMKLFIIVARDVAWLQRLGIAFQKSIQKTVDYYGHTKNVFALILISFGIDPMTGRAAALAAGHGFVTGWLIAITGDMMCFSILMAATLWLSKQLGDGTVAMLIILALMIVLPPLIRRLWKPRSVVTRSRPDDRLGL